MARQDRSVDAPFPESGRRAHVPLLDLGHAQEARVGYVVVEEALPRVRRLGGNGAGGKTAKQPSRFPPLLVVPPRGVRSGFRVETLRAVVQEQRARDTGELGVVQGEPIAWRAPSVGVAVGGQTGTGQRAGRGRERHGRFRGVQELGDPARGLAPAQPRERVVVVHGIEYAHVAASIAPAGRARREE